MIIFLLQVGIDTKNFQNIKDDVDFTEKLVSEQSVFCLPAKVSVFLMKKIKIKTGFYICPVSNLLTLIDLGVKYALRIFSYNRHWN